MVTFSMMNLQLRNFKIKVERTTKDGFKTIIPNGALTMREHMQVLVAIDKLVEKYGLQDADMVISKIKEGL